GVEAIAFDGLDLVRPKRAGHDAFPQAGLSLRKLGWQVVGGSWSARGGKQATNAQCGHRDRFQKNLMGLETAAWAVHGDSEVTRQRPRVEQREAGGVDNTRAAAGMAVCVSGCDTVSGRQAARTCRMVA